jgi:hypothetical protein
MDTLKAMKEKYNDAYRILGEIACMKCLCTLCATLRNVVFEVARNSTDPTEALQVIKRYEGFVCGAVETIKEKYHNWEERWKT